jgi:organic radical activating enzyme
VEIFSGIQGEGIFVGVRHLFVRLAGCNRACRYCDTPEARQAPPTCAVEQEPGSRRFVQVANPLTVPQVVEAVTALDQPHGLHDSVSLTGGEPLCHAAFLAALCPRLQAAGLATYLETNGTLPDALEPIVGCFNHVAMDIKLESATGEATDWAAHRRFLEILSLRAKQVKIVVAAGTTDGELRRAAEIIVLSRLPMAVVLQPVTPVGGVRPPSPERLLAMQRLLWGLLPSGLRDIRVIPQVHKLIGQK